jgi:hypothetical protein
VSFGEMLYRSWDAVLRCREQGLDVGLINKPTLNLVDEKVGSASIVTTHWTDSLKSPDDQEDRVNSIRACSRVSQSKNWGTYIL